MHSFNVIDLFCGCGGLSLGFENAGFNVLLGIDNDKKALETFELHHHGAKTICGDITEINYSNHIKPIIGDNPIDVIIGGPPCQGMSLSGPRKFDDPRNKLYLSYIRLLCLLICCISDVKYFDSYVAKVDFIIWSIVWEKITYQWRNELEMRGKTSEIRIYISIKE